MIISNFLQNDIYKITMQQAVCKCFPRAMARYEFINRGCTKFPENFDIALRQEIMQMGKVLSLTAGQADFLNKMHFLSPVYVDFLRSYKYDPSEIVVTQEGNDIAVVIEGPWYKTILWEVPLLAIISELYFEVMGHRICMTLDDRQEWVESIRRKNIEKANIFRACGAKVAEFGTRRRYSGGIQQVVLGQLLEFCPDCIVGTSNLAMANMFNIKAIGTQAHEWFMFHAAKYGFWMANKMAMENWVNVYRGELGIALTDTFMTDDFFRVFDTKFAKLYDGLRHDSGDPYEFGEKAIEHYKRLGIDPKSKTIVFSDSLNPEIVVLLQDRFVGRIKTSYGMGTNLTNDVGVKPLNIVIKMTAAKPEGLDWIPTVKLSDDSGKHTGSSETVELCKTTLGLG